jgi:uncharacterized protein YkwD
MVRNARLLGHGRRPGLAALALSLAACAAGGASGAGGTSSASRASGEGGRGGGPQGQFAPSIGAALAYGAKVGRCPSAGALREVMGELEAAAKRGGRPQPVADGPVCAVAETFLRWDPAAGPPRPQVLAFVSQWFGLPNPVAPPSIAVIETEDTRIIAERIVQAVGNSVLNAVSPRIGIATQRVKRDATKVVVVLLDAPVEIDPPFPRRLEPGQKATLSGRLLAGLKSPKVQVSDATGQVSTPEQPAGEAFKAEVSCGDRPGRILVDIRGELEGRSGLVANFPVACGGALPTSISLAPEPWPTDPLEAEKRIFELVNQERGSAGLSTLKWDDGVAGVARAISEDLAARGGAAGGDVADRLKRAGIASPLVLQSAASERSFERVHERLVASPSNRSNIMNRDVTNLGIGAVSKPDAEGKPMVFVTEIFSKELPPADIGKIRKDLKAAVAQKRKDARMSALTVDSTLDETAQKYAQALAAAGGTLSKEKQNELSAPLNKTMRTLTILSGAKPEPLDFAEEPQVTAMAKAVGIGAAQGAHPVLGRNAVYVVIMVGTPRGEAAEAPKPAVKGSRKAPAKPGSKTSR